MTAVRMHHLALTTHQVEALAGFYRALFALPELRRHHDEQGLRSIWLGLENSILMIERCDHAPSRAQSEPFKNDSPGYHLLAFNIEEEEFEAWRRRLSKARIKIEDQSEFTLYFRDPDGNRLGLSCFRLEPLTN